jgi:hypothetical protein
VLFDAASFCAATVFGRVGVGDVPVYEGFTGYVGDVVEIDYLSL